MPHRDPIAQPCPSPYRPGPTLAPTLAALALSALLLAAPPGLAGDAPALCATASGGPEPDAAALLAEKLVAAQDGSAVYVDRFDLQDRDGDGRADVLLLLRDESYDGNPVYGLTYYRGEETGFCGRQVFDGRAALGGRPTALKLGAITGGYPEIRFAFYAADPARRIASPVTQTFRFDPGTDAYAQLP